MKVGTKSLLFGVHNFIWHPFTVWLAWIYLYKQLPSWKDLICIIVHDWGYWGSPNIDGPEGEEHPRFGARIVWRLFKSNELFRLCLYHSRHYAKSDNAEPSKLCWADKYSIKFDPWFLYLPRAWLSGELREYRAIAAAREIIDIDQSHRVWYRWVVVHLQKLGTEKKGDAAPYVNNNHNKSEAEKYAKHWEV